MNPAKNNSKKSGVRLVQFKMRGKAHEDLEKARDATGSLTLSETIRDAIKLYTWVIEKRAQGYTLFCLPEDGKEEKYEVVLP